MQSTWGLLAVAALVAVASALPAELSRPRYPQISKTDTVLYGRVQRSSYDELVASVQRLRQNPIATVQPVQYLEVFVWSMDVGTPPAFFNVSLETGTQQTFLFDKSFKPLYKYGRTYEPSRSKTAVKVNDRFRDTKWPLTVQGDTYRDTLKWVFNHTQRFGVVKSLTGFGGKEFPADGVLGLAWPVNGKAPTKGPDSLAVANLLGNSTARKYQIWVDGDFGILSFGSDKLSHKPPTYFPLVQNVDRPILQADGLEFGEFKITTPFKASLDTGYGAILLPKQVFQHVLDTYKPAFDQKAGIYTLACTSKLPDLVFSFGGQKYSLPKERLLQKVGYWWGKCALAIGEDPSTEPAFTLGTPFFREHIVGFDLDNSKASLAPYWR